jgi:Na+/H+-dicarboxylate symporter
MENIHAMALMGKKVIKYTLITTVIAATVALFAFLVLDPVSGSQVHAPQVNSVQAEPGSYWAHLLNVIPSNVVQPFANNNVMGVLVLAFIISLGMFAIPNVQRQVLHGLFSALYSVFMRITAFIVRLIPIALWAFIALFVRDVQAGLEIKSIGLYLAAVLAANLVQGFIVLPLLLKFKGISPVGLAKAMFPALTVAFFTKSSSATVPSAVRCAQERAKMDPKVASFAFPLCTSINMNGCAAFILITVLFVSMLNGLSFSYLEMVMWIFMATLAALGNASVPMGCFFLAGAFLAAMNVPLNIMGVILPFYAFLDAIETAINVWSDSCVASVVNRDLAKEEELVPLVHAPVTP